MFDRLRSIRHLFQFFRWHRSMTRKDESGRASGFIYSPDDPAVADYHREGTIFGRRVFISFEKSSLELASRFESALQHCGLEPWRYEPAEAISAIDGEHSLGTIREKYPETMARLVASVRRCPAALFIVSQKTHASPLCQLEAFAATIIHSFWPENRTRNEAGIFVVLERQDVSVPATLEKYWSRVYEDDLEEALAELLSNEIDRLAEILSAVEARRAKIYR